MTGRISLTRNRLQWTSHAVSACVVRLTLGLWTAMVSFSFGSVCMTAAADDRVYPEWSSPLEPNSGVKIVAPPLPPVVSPDPGYYDSSTFGPSGQPGFIDDAFIDDAIDYEARKITPGSGSRGEEAAAVRLAISGDLLKDVFRRTNCETGGVDDFILGAKVTGEQQTKTTTELVLVPSTGQAAFEVVLSGVTNSETFGATAIAGVVSSSNNRFEMRKPFSFDGRTIRTSTPAATVWPQQTNRAAVPLRGNIPVLRRVIGSIAYREAERRKPASQRITAYRVTEDASGQFNTRVDEALAELQSGWSDKLIPLAKKHLPNIDLPIARTTATHAIFSLPSPWARANEDPLAGDWVERGDSISFAVHESALLAGIERLNLGGLTVAPGDYDRAIRQFAPGVVDGDAPVFAAQTGSLVLDETNPAYVKFRNGEFTVVMNARIKTPVGELPMQKITMPWTFAADETSVFVDPGTPTVESASDESSPMMAIVRPIIVSQLQQELISLRMPRAITVPGKDDADDIRLLFQDVKCRDGWLVLGWQAFPIGE